MTHFAVTFRIASNSTYQSRYDSFNKKIRELTEGAGMPWMETTSFAAFQSTGTADDVCNSLYVGSDFNATTDTMVVIDLDRRQKATKGVIEYPATLTGSLGF